MRLLLATLAILFGSQADSQQLSTTLPFEAIVNLGSQTGNGADRSWPITFNGTINAIDGNVSLGFPMGYVPATTANTPAPHMTPAAFGEALVNCWLASGSPTYSANPQAFYAGPPVAGLGNFGASSDYVTAGQDIPVYGAGMPPSGGLWSRILKAAPPASDHATIDISGLSIAVTVGEQIVCHIDGSSMPAGTPEDVEGGWTIFYTPN
ncbi:hypothetical protein [Rhodoblastus sp.]|uniref:hypothetical protein n=1 Tax=Rhodoblastus sp. TaxID=1962975 RepID=UPI003F9DBDE8